MEAHTQDLQFRRHQQHGDSKQRSGDSTTTSPPIVIVILRQQLDYVIVDYGRVYAAPNKS
jgi:hypothetical protein